MKDERLGPEDPSIQASIREAATLIRSARYLTAFTGAGISVESGVPPFRGEGGLWSTYDPRTLELAYFHRHPKESWEVLRAIFYKHLAEAQPNEAHRVLAGWEAQGLIKVLITQNIDNLHFLAGSREVIEFHGNSRDLVCLGCGKTRAANPLLLCALPPRCTCGGVLKPDLVFFGEGIPEGAWHRSRRAIEQTDVMLVVGSTGEVYPAASLPIQASSNGARIIEINPQPSHFTSALSDIYIPLQAAEALPFIDRELDS